MSFLRNCLSVGFAYWFYVAVVAVLLILSVMF